MVQVIDLGQKTTTRKNVRKMTVTKNKPKISTEAAKAEAAKPTKKKMHEKISIFENLENENRRKADKPLSENKPKKPPGVVKLTDKARKIKNSNQEELTGARKKTQGWKTTLSSQNKHDQATAAMMMKPKMIESQEQSRYPKEVHVKKTSTPNKVKIGSKEDKTLWKLNSPSFKSRFKTPKKAAKGALSRLTNHDANSPVKNIKFKTLLKSWELTSNKHLTSAVVILPRSSQNADSQSEKSLQTKENLATGI